MLKTTHYSVAALIGLCLSASVSQAQANAYIGIDGTSISVSNSVEDHINPRGMRARLGLQLNEVLDVELQIGGGKDHTTTAFDSLSTTYMGGYLKAYLPIGYKSALFALGGLSTVELEQSTATGVFTDDRTGFSYGFGLETRLSDRLDLSADYMRYALDDDEFSELSTINLGLKWYF